MSAPLNICAVLGSALIGLSGWAIPSFAQAEYPSIEAFAAAAEPGQVYSCLSEDDSHALALRIGVIEDLSPGTIAYHVQIRGVKPPDLPPLGHIPLSDVSFARCLLDPELEPLLEPSFDDDGFSEGLAQWREANGGVFTVDATEIYDIVLQALQGDDQ